MSIYDLPSDVILSGQDKIKSVIPFTHTPPLHYPTLSSTLYLPLHCSSGAPLDTAGCTPDRVPLFSSPLELASSRFPSYPSSSLSQPVPSQPVPSLLQSTSSPVNQSHSLREYQVSTVSLRFPYKSPKLHKPVMKYIPFFLSSPYGCSPFPIPPLLVATQP